MLTKERFQKAIAYLKGRQIIAINQDVVEKMGINKTSFSLAFNGNEKYLTKSFFKRFNSAFEDIFNEEWLLTGEGEMLKTYYKPNEKPPLQVNDYGVAYSATYDASNSQVVITPGRLIKLEPGEIPLIPYEIVEKIGLDNYLSALEHGYERYIVPEFCNADFLTRMKGNTMYPKYSNGDVIACKYFPLDTFYQWNKIYAFNTNQGLLIKRVHEGIDDEHLMLSSDNERYPAFQISKKYISAHALVLGSIRLD